MTPCSPLSFAPVIDIFPDLCGVAYTAAGTRRKMEILAQYGFDRVYLVVPPPGYPMFSNPWLDLLRVENQAGNYAVESLLACGDPTFEHIYEAHRQGLQAFAIVKPYEGGGGYTVPHGRRSLLRSRAVTCLGGERCSFDALLRERPDLRVERRPRPDYERLMAQPITRLRLLFCLDRVEEGVDHNRTRVFEAQPDEVVSSCPVTAAQLWLSDDNGEYRRYDGPMTIRERLVRETLCDANGTPLFDAPSRCRELLLDELAIDAGTPYLAVRCGPGSERLVSIPASMVQAFGPVGEVPLTCTPYIRGRSAPAASAAPGAPAADEWFDPTYPATADDHPELLDAFAHQGFEFEWYGSGHWGDGWRQAACLGLARGKLTHLKGTPCEAYPEVREYWLDQVAKLVAMGIDGVDLRLQNHSGMVSDYANYGFNPPLVEAYRQAYGTDPLGDGFDPLAMMRIRGRFLHQFVTAAADLLHAAGKPLQLHLHDCYEDPRLSSTFGELGFWAMPKVLPDWEAWVDLADEITIKDYNFGRYQAARSPRIKDRAAAQGKPLWVHCYIAQGNDLNSDFFAAVAQDDRVTGVLLYEMGHNPYANNPWAGLLEVRPRGEVVVNPTVHERLVELLGR